MEPIIEFLYSFLSSEWFPHLCSLRTFFVQFFVVVAVMKYEISYVAKLFTFYI